MRAAAAQRVVWRASVSKVRRSGRRGWRDRHGIELVVVPDGVECLATVDGGPQADAEHEEPRELAVQGVDLVGRRALAVLEHDGHVLAHARGQLRCRKVERLSGREGLPEDEARRDVRVVHLPRLIAGEKAQAQARVHDGVAVAARARVNHAQVVVDKGLGVLAGRPKVNQGDCVRGRVIQVVAPVGVCLHEAPLKELEEREGEDAARHGVAPPRAHALHGLHGPAGEPLRREHARRRELGDHRGHAEGASERGVGSLSLSDQGAVPVRVRRLLGVVALGEELLLGHADDVVHEERARQHARVVGQAP
mmetsp:Transcript_18013/g.48453  ORF Transcript_18013/g.48453 Transcript_18013/m.48453 type:complete len:308 (-) Transcript_18013:1038-1961(-)